MTFTVRVFALSAFVLLSACERKEPYSFGNEAEAPQPGSNKPGNVQSGAFKAPGSQPQPQSQPE